MIYNVLRGMGSVILYEKKKKKLTTRERLENSLDVSIAEIERIEKISIVHV